MAELRRPWREIDANLFRFTTTDLRDLHLAVMVAFEEAAVLAPAMNLDQVRNAVGALGWDEALDDEALLRALGALAGWNLLEATQDHAARYATPDEFERRNLQWSLTPRGEAAVGGALHALGALRHAVGLQPAVLDAIGDGLGELADLLRQPAGGGAEARIATRLAEIEAHLVALVTSVRQFNGHLQRLLRDDGTDDVVFAEVKRRTVAYLEQYVDGVERPHRRVATAIDRLEGLGTSTLFDRALTGANLAPVAGGDPGPAWLAERSRRWAALRTWFAPLDEERPRIAGLLDVARTAILELLRVLERRWDARRRSASVANDFRVLARWFAATPADGDAHRLFAAAFGVWPARHAHLASLDGEGRVPQASWLATAPVEVAPSLRTTGTLTNRGRSRPVADPSALRALRQHRQAEALAAYDAVRHALATDGMVRLSAFGSLDREAFAELLALLAVALDAAPGADGGRRALSTDGRVEVTLRHPGDGRTASLVTTDGVLRGPDLLVGITVAGSSAPDAGRAAGAGGA